MPSGAKSGGRESAARARRALERRAAMLGIQVTRSLQDRWRRMPPARRARLEGLAANVTERARERPADRADVDEIEVRDLRAELTRELDRLAGADIRASRGNGRRAGETHP